MERAVTKEPLVSMLVLLLSTAFILYYFKPDLLLSETTVSGGDTASYFYTVKYLTEAILPNGAITGWSMGWYAGFPMFQFYFPLPFLIIAAFGLVMPLTIALKLVTILGTVLLPSAVFLFLRNMKFEFPVPAIGAAMALPFLFMEANSMWGGNIPSTLAGEFSYSLAIALGIMFLGFVYGDAEKKHWIRNGALFAAIVLTHIIVAMWIVLTTSFFLITKEWRDSLAYFFKLYAIAFLLACIWILPLLANIEYTTTYADNWQVPIEQIFPEIIAVFLVFSLAALRHFKDRRIQYIVYSIVAASALFIAGESTGVINIRFVPFLQMMLLVLGACSFLALKEKRKLWLVPLIFLVLTGYWVDGHVKYIDDWVKWNYSGFEGKPKWETFKEINEFLAGGVNDPRAVYEHSDVHNQMGTPRAFESLPLFTGRSTLEGLLMQSSPTSPFVFYMQSEISEQQSCPFFTNYPCTTFDLEKGAEHMRMFNVKYYIAVSDKAKNSANASPEFALVKRVDNYDIYELVGNENRYVTVPEFYPVPFKTDNWKSSFYRWFKGDTSVRLFAGDEAFTGSITDVPWVPLNVSCVVSEKIENARIEFNTSCPGKPHIISISYHPNWQAEEKIYLVSPSFMLVYPKGDNVILTYKDGPADYAGKLLSLVGIVIAAYYIFLKNRRALKHISAVKR